MPEVAKEALDLDELKALCAAAREFLKPWEWLATAPKDIGKTFGELANAFDSLIAEVERLPGALREQIASHLLMHVGGDETDPWQAGHDYAMHEAARIVRERLDTL